MGELGEQGLVVAPERDLFESVSILWQLL